jgi:hypothetical protein
MCLFKFGLNFLGLNSTGVPPFFRPSRLHLLTVLGIFRNNPFTIVIPLAFYLFLLRAGAWTGHVMPPETVQTGGFLYNAWFLWIAQSPFWSAVTAFVLVLIQALSVNMLADNFRLMADRNWFPGLFYGLAAGALPEFLWLSPALVAATFVPFSLWRIFNAYQKPQVTAAIFDGALWISVASLFYPPALWLLIAAFAGYSVVRVFRLNERFVFLFGAFVPLFLAWVWYFWADKGAEFRATHWSGLFRLFDFEITWDEQMLLKTGLTIALVLVFLSGLGSFYHRKGIQAQKFISVLYWFFALGGLSVLLNKHWHWEHLLITAPVMGIFLALVFQGIQNRLWAETWHLILLALVLFIQYFDVLSPVLTANF